MLTEHETTRPEEKEAVSINTSEQPCLFAYLATFLTLMLTGRQCSNVKSGRLQPNKNIYNLHTYTSKQV